MPTLSWAWKKLVPNMNQILDMNKSLNEGAILLSGFGVGSWHWNIFAESGFLILIRGYVIIQK